ncbi:hypothetical protein GCM10022279_30700 [Comamonas faecalis]|uniref:PilY1 beta-propeller domain-containing protein n=2 Tax=Comamonas faecalis TaxID=1387849 RepID=A0ABP7S042_9BURK
MSDGEKVRSLDLWHAALNGRGRFYAVETGKDLEKAFREIIGSINTQTEPDMTSSATSGSNVSRNAVGKFTGNYEPKKAWKGFLTAETVKTDGSTEPAEGWQGQNTAARIDAMSAGARNIISWSDKKNASYQDQGGVEFKWASDETRLSAAQKLSLQQNIAGADQGAAQGEARLNYIRGDRSKEGTPPAQPFRPRQSAQGDIINSDVWYTGGAVSNYALKGYVDFIKAQRDRSPILYVGGNDGMLHGFLADNGKEQLAYVPKGVIPRLRYLTDASFDQNHKFFVDGSPMTGDVDIDEKNHDASNPAKDWRTMLVGALGAGGKGYFVLDVTNPGSFDKNSALVDRTRSADDAAANCTALTGAALTTCQTVRDEDADIGYITAKPVKDDANPMRSTQITRLNNDRWAVVLGNGYNSTNQRPVLLIQYLDGARELKRIVAASDDTTGSGRASDNGLSAPRLVDINGDLRVDVAYAGDNLGNLWKFDLTSDDASQWGVAFDGEPLFTARGPTALGDASRLNIQPITAPPTVRANDRFKCEVDAVSEKCKPGTSKAVGGMMVAFGTGRNVSKADESDVKVQTLYSVLDNTRYKLVDTIDGKRKRLEIHPGDTDNNIPAPAALGTGVDDAKLAAQKITTATEDGRAYGTITPEAKVNWATHNGWYMDLPAIGERLLKPLEFYDGSNLLVMYSQVPAKGSDVDPEIESCTSTSVDKERQYRTFVNVMDGAKPSVKLMDTIGDFSRAEVAAGAHTLIARGNKVLDFGPKGGAKPGEDPGQPDVLNRMPEQSLRPSWRQIQ